MDVAAFGELSRLEPSALELLDVVELARDECLELPARGRDIREPFASNTDGPGCGGGFVTFTGAGGKSSTGAGAGGGAGGANSVRSSDFSCEICVFMLVSTLACSCWNIAAQSGTGGVMAAGVTDAGTEDEDATELID